MTETQRKTCLCFHHEMAQPSSFTILSNLESSNLLDVALCHRVTWHSKFQAWWSHNNEDLNSPAAKAKELACRILSHTMLVIWRDHTSCSMLCLSFQSDFLWHSPQYVLISCLSSSCSKIRVTAPFICDPRSVSANSGSAWKLSKSSNGTCSRFIFEINGFKRSNRSEGSYFHHRTTPYNKRQKNKVTPLLQHLGI